jgi:hypothetical protein
VFDIQGFNYPSWWNGDYASAESNTAIHELARTNANAIAIVPTVYLDHKGAYQFKQTTQTERRENVGKAIERAVAKGLSVMLKPHVDTSDHVWRGELAPADVTAWFAGYKALMVDYARLAEEKGASTLCLGVELRSLSGARFRPYWTDLIDAVRGVFQGELTYAANWDEVGQVSFWDKVDVIGVDPYVPLTGGNDPSVQQLVDAWTQVPSDTWRASVQDGKSTVDFYRDVSVRYGKPVLFTELGYRSLDGANTAPGDWQRQGRFDPQEQLDLVDAFFTVWSVRGGDWFKGVHFWNWEMPAKVASQKLGYTPQGKPAQMAITAWFGGLRLAEARR